MIRARLSPAAQRDLQKIRDTIARDKPEAAERVRSTILDAADLLATNRELGRRILGASRRHPDVRWLVVPKFRNYLLFYRPFQDTILVLRILHAAQDWKRFYPSV
jgi:plasmid stabilization system protein ParE